MATSPIYGWLEPDNTDLVKNGALAIRTLGNAIDTTMGTMTPKSIVDAKGDLIAASANDTPARLAVGANGETLVADSSTSTGLRYQAPVNANPVLNSAFQVWQRGTSFAFNNSNGYTADRWYAQVPNTAATISRQVTNDTTNLPFIQYCARLARNSGSTSTGAITFQQSFETINSIPYVGKTVTFSFYARAGANFSAASSNLVVYLITGTGTDQNHSNGYTGQALPVSTNATLTTTWQRFTYTATLAATATEIATAFTFSPTGTAGANDWYEITGLQLEVGSVATPFKTYAGTIQGETSACQRYYQLIASGTSKILGVGYYVSATGIDGPIINLPVEMRTTPTISIVSGTNYFLSVSAGGGNDNLNSVTLASESTNRTAFFFNNSEAAGTAGQGCRIQTNNAAAFLAVQAEL